jgi:hypothetical protein
MAEAIAGGGGGSQLMAETDPFEFSIRKVENYGNLELSLRLIQLLCEGHNGRAQNYFREQLDNVFSVNIPAEVAHTLAKVCLNTTAEVLPIITQALTTLVEARCPPSNFAC